MRAGELRHRITIQQQTVVRDSFGGETITWPDLATVWASKAHKSSREFFAAQKINAEIQELFVVRYRSGVTAKMRVSYDSKYYDIIGVYDPDGRKRELRLLCKEVV